MEQDLRSPMARLTLLSLPMAQSTNTQDQQHNRNKAQGSETNDELQPQESGKEGSSCHYYSAPLSLSFSLLCLTQFFLC